ncbi:NAD(P)-dependent alcohol dehydrogenase [Staphylococcus cohnii]|uniref:Alcohol dehydrogenase n=1 Tax=Staphylococcus ureilyticus TaxID=94138 RepID=A0AB34AJS0_STAUR|nr:NAD(P)-dependent alcohol dehydrogenase [Staphylococcus ureilyticus]AVL77272.1 NAD(P)-dependent alcohol dehydrogenase [Staphylococcus cohnii]MBM9448145.1 NAD(P)-dependent alcohol dehydrogenase [Staphylococcus ureilyticus]MCT1914686.1 NAD(P)-dependent alcohol dehydrogenase [Staphylococcus ureilyticus]PNZ47347.1 alcohol dehydrogenase [Staphylococcus ureilyticus]PTF45444.1 NAD(P)-dependent alcohol dehydrogenase [Staphylococcus cohnii]
MKAWHLENFGLDNLKQVEVDKPKINENQILVKVNSVSLNYRDTAIVEGVYTPELLKFPFVPVSDASGEVVEIGSNVTKFKIGDRVTSHMFTTWLEGKPKGDEQLYALGATVNGGLSEYMVLNESATVLSPETYTDNQASTLPVAAFVVWFSLVEYGNIKAGDRVLVQGTGGVSIFAIQIASALGAEVIATSSSDEKLEKAKELGASKVINYKTHPDWEKEVQKLTNGKGVEHIVEVVGGSSIAKSIEALAFQGNIYVIGFLENMEAEVNLFSLLAKQAKIQGINVGHHRAFEDFTKALDKLNIDPIIDNVYSFDQAKEAYEHQMKGAFGKIVIDFNK